MNKQLVAYFSASGVTKKVAQDLATAIEADVYEIKPEVPYTDEDLNWLNKKSRSSVEMKDKKSRPAIVNDGFDVSAYDTIFLGFPIWWYIAPTIINTFLEAHDFSNKTIVLFATSGGSGFGEAVEGLKASVAETTVIKEGEILNGRQSVDALKAWAESL